MGQPTSQQTWYTFSNRAAAPDAAAEVSIYDDIGAYGVTAKQFVKDLKSIDAPTIHLRLNTAGGDVFDATAIHNALVEHPADIIVHIDGVAASAGSFVAMAGNEVRMADNAYVMIHEAWGGVMGTAEEMQTYADVLEKMNENIAGMYQKKSGRNTGYWRELMSEETWFTAEQAKEVGLVDAIDEAVPAPSVASNCSHGKFYNLAKVPDAVKAMLGLNKTPPINTGPWTTGNDACTACDAVTYTATVTGINNQTTETTNPATASPEGEARPDIHKEPSQMATDTNVATTAPTPAAATGSTMQGNTPVEADAEREHRREVDRIKGLTAEAQFNQGVVKGTTLGRAEQIERMKALLAVCPGKPQMAIDGFLAGQAPESVKLAFDAAAAVEAAAKIREREKDLEIARWQNLAAAGGYPDGVAMALEGHADDGNAEHGEASEEDHKLRAEAEWNRNCLTNDGKRIRTAFSSKERYVAFRVRDLAGTIQTRIAPAQA